MRLIGEGRLTIIMKNFFRMVSDKADTPKEDTI